MLKWNILPELQCIFVANILVIISRVHEYTFVFSNKCVGMHLTKPCTLNFDMILCWCYTLSKISLKAHYISSMQPSRKKIFFEWNSLWYGDFGSC
jgi:hypothetical protein